MGWINLAAQIIGLARDLFRYFTAKKKANAEIAVEVKKVREELKKAKTDSQVAEVSRKMEKLFL
jgi:hypothetical protein